MEDRGDGRREEQRGARRPRREEEDGPDRGRDDAEEEEEGGRRAVRPRLAPPAQLLALNQERNVADSDGSEDDDEDEEVEDEEDEEVEIEQLFEEDVEEGEYDTVYSGDEEEVFDERGAALVSELRGRRGRPNASAEQILRQLSVEGTADLVRRYGGDGSVLWRHVLDRRIFFSKALFQSCCRTFSPEKMAELLRRLVSFVPNLLSRRDNAGGFQNRDRGVTLLHLAVRTGAPVETIRLIAGMNSGALLLRDRRGLRPLHDACVWKPTLPLIMAVLDTSRDAVRKRTRRGEFPLHLAAEHLMTGEPSVLEAIQWLIDVYPEALNSRTRLGLTPIMMAVNRAEWGAPVESRALDLLLHMVKLAPESLRTQHGSYALTALRIACARCPYMELVAPLTVACTGALSDRGASGQLPLHNACSQLLQTDSSEHLWEVIRFLMNAYPDALWARDSCGMTPIVTALKYVPAPALWHHQSVKLLPLLLDMIRRGGARSLWGERSDWRWNGPRDGRPRAARTAVELACGSLQYPLDLEVVSPLMEAHPAALCVCLLRDDIVAVDDTVYPMVEGFSPQQARQQHFRELRREQEQISLERAAADRRVRVWRAEVADAVVTGARAAFLAAADVLIHEATRGAVPDPIRARVRQILSRHVPPDVAGNGNSLTLVRSVRDRVRGDALWQLRSEVLDDVDLQSFLQSSQVFQDLISGVYRMNKAGRLGGLGGPIGGSEVDGEAAAAAASSASDAAAERHARILAAAGDSPSCLFLRVRESPALFGIHGPPERTAAAAAAAVRSSLVAGAAE
jgi:hypothetical protein